MSSIEAKGLETIRAALDHYRERLKKLMDEHYSDFHLYAPIRDDISNAIAEINVLLQELKDVNAASQEILPRLTEVYQVRKNAELIKSALSMFKADLIASRDSISKKVQLSTFAVTNSSIKDIDSVFAWLERLTK